ncbi:unnamed protein product [Cunninghamella echinulata]
MNKRFHIIQIIHLWNCILGIITASVLIGTAKNVKEYVTAGALVNGFGNYNVFTYPATFVYMFIPVISSLIYAGILTFDPSPQYVHTWQPSKTLTSSIICVSIALILASLWPLVPGADVMTKPDASIDCSWKYYMSWYVIFANPEAFPWVTLIDQACTCFRAGVGLCWVLSLGWIFQSVLYFRRTCFFNNNNKRQQSASLHPQISERSARTLSMISYTNTNNTNTNNNTNHLDEKTEVEYHPHPPPI